MRASALGPFERIPLADHEQLIATDLLGTLYGSYCAYRAYDVVETIVRLPHAAEEKMAARYMHKTQVEKAPPAGDSPNALREPMRAGTEVSAGRRA
jgi:hypothetical protein